MDEIRMVVKALAMSDFSTDLVRSAVFFYGGCLNIKLASNI